MNPIAETLLRPPLDPPPEAQDGERGERREQERESGAPRRPQQRLPGPRGAVGDDRVADRCLCNQGQGLAVERLDRPVGVEEPQDDRGAGHDAGFVPGLGDPQIRRIERRVLRHVDDPPGDRGRAPRGRVGPRPAQPQERLAVDDDGRGGDLAFDRLPLGAFFLRDGAAAPRREAEREDEGQETPSGDHTRTIHEVPVTA